MAWNQSTGEATKPTPKKPSAMRGVIAGVVVVAAAVAVAIYFMSRKSAHVEVVELEINPGLIKEVKPTVATTNALATSTPAPAPEPAEPKPLKWLGHNVVKFTAQTNEAAGIIVESYVTDDGKLHKHIIERDDQPFDNVADQTIAMAISTPPGKIMPALPLYPGFERDFEEAMKKPVEFKDDDTPEVRQLKEQVAATRESVKQMLAEGQTIREILTEHQKIWNENAELHAKYQRELSEIVRSGDMESARKYELKMNVALQQMGIPQIRIPDLNKRKRTAQTEPRNVTEE